MARTWDDGPQGVAILNYAVQAGPLAVRMGDFDLARSFLIDVAERTTSFRDAQFTSPIFVGIIELALPRVAWTTRGPRRQTAWPGSQRPKTRRSVTAACRCRACGGGPCARRGGGPSRRRA